MFSDRVSRWGLTPRHAVVALLAAGAALAMLLTSDQMSDLRVALPPLSRAMNWLEGLPVPLDMDHVVFFAMLAGGLRVLLPNASWWRLFLLLAALAVGTELLQFGTVGRTPKMLDVRDDMIGSGIGMLLGTLPLWCARQATSLLRLSAVLLLAGIALLTWQQWPIASAFGFPVLLPDALFVIALVVRLFALAGGQAPIRMGGLHGWSAAYLLAMLLAVLVLPPLQAPSVPNGFSCPVPSPEFMPAVAKWIGIAWLALIAALSCDAAGRSETLRRRMAQAWLLGVCVAALAAWVAILGFYAGEVGSAIVAPLLSHYGSLPPGPYPRVAGLFANANMAGLFLLLSIGVALVARDAGWLSIRRLRMFLWLLSMPILATGSQAIGAVILLLAWWRFDRREQPRAGQAAMLGLAALLASSLLAVLLVNPDAAFVQPSVRMQLWRQAWATWQGAFWRGVGLGQPPASLDYLAPDGGWQYLTDAHNIVLNLGAQGGVVAVAAFCGLVGWVWWQARRIPSLRGARAALLLAVAYLGIGGSFEDARVLWVFMGLVAGACIACMELQGSRRSVA